MLFQKCVMHVSILIFSDVSVESLFRSSFTTLGSRRLFPPPPLRLPSRPEARRQVDSPGLGPQGRRGAVTANLGFNGHRWRGEKGAFHHVQSRAHISFHFLGLCVLWCLDSASLCIYKKKVEQFLYESIQGFRSDANKCHFQFTFVVKPTV